MNHRKQVLAVNGHRRHYIVVNRNCMAWEPSFCVVAEGSGASADAVAQFYSQQDANDYCDWRNPKTKNEVR